MTTLALVRRHSCFPMANSNLSRSASSCVTQPSLPCDIFVVPVEPDRTALVPRLSARQVEGDSEVSTLPYSWLKSRTRRLGSPYATGRNADEPAFGNYEAGTATR
ncbi:hypothetical protein RHECNPAF_14110064 [Rhizobium etli CNPAF512]|nr:hypothetical protein RHECNPAF_14110064 [Rhizobium etli CNPAF512]